MSVVALNAVQTATASATGAATFTFAAPAAGEQFQGTVIVPGAPTSATIVANLSGSPITQWQGATTGGPVQADVGQVLTVVCTGLVPGLVYQCNWTGTSTNGLDNPDPIWPQPQTSTVLAQTNQVFLAGPLAVSLGTTAQVTLQASWRSLWIVQTVAAPPMVTGNQSGLTYEPFTPPYLQAPATFFRFPLVSGIDTSVTITFEAACTAWYGADLADIDTATYSTSGGGLLTVTFELPYTYSVSGLLAVPSGATNYLPPFNFPIVAGQSATLQAVRAWTRSGTSITANIQQNGTTIGGLSGIVIGTTPTTYTPTVPPSVANWDQFAPVITAISGTPDGLSLTFSFAVTG